MANVSRPVNLYSATDYAVLGLKNQEPKESKKKSTTEPKGKSKPKKPKKPVKKTKKPSPKRPRQKIAEVNRKKLLPWM